MSPFNIVTLANFYGVSTNYLLGLTEQKNHPNADFNNLHLSDDMIDLLESGKINTRLLCEIATHEDFRRFLTDIEIYVDLIISTIRENHKIDRTTADTISLRQMPKSSCRMH